MSVFMNGFILRVKSPGDFIKNPKALSFSRSGIFEKIPHFIDLNLISVLIDLMMSSRSGNLKSFTIFLDNNVVSSI